MANHGIYTNTTWAHGIQFEDVDGAPLALIGTYECAVIRRGDSGDPLFTFNSADGTLDHSAQSMGRLVLTATPSKHQPSLAAGSYRLQLRRVDGADAMWGADGRIVIGKPGDSETYIFFDSATEGNMITSYVVAVGGPKGDKGDKGDTGDVTPELEAALGDAEAARDAAITAASDADADRVAVETSVSLVDADRVAAEEAASKAETAFNALVQVSRFVSDLSSPTADDLLPFVLAEFDGGATGAVYSCDKEYLWQDTSKTTPVTAAGQSIACIGNVLAGSATDDYDLIQVTSGEQGVYREAFGMGYVEWSGGDGYNSRSTTLSWSVPNILAAAISSNGTSLRYLFGHNKNTNTRHVLAHNTLSRVEGSSQGVAPDLARAWVQSTSANYSFPHTTTHTDPQGPVTVMTSKMKGGKIDCVVEGSSVRDTNIEKSSNWVDGDTVTGSTFVLSATSSTNVHTDVSGTFWGGVYLNADPQNEAAIVSWLQARSRPAITASDRVILVVGDSTGDNVGQTSDVVEEVVTRWARDELAVTDHPDDCIVQIDWNREGDCFKGNWGHGDRSKLKRTFVVNCSSAGSQPGYFFGERFTRTIGTLPRVDYVIWNHGHNLPVDDAVIQADASVDLYRLGQFMDANEQLRAAFPDAQHLIFRTYPVGLAADNRIAGVVESVDTLAAKYADMTTIDLYTPWLLHRDTVSTTDWWETDHVHPLVPTGVTEMLTHLAAAYTGLSTPDYIAPSILKSRKILPSENLLLNGQFEDWTAGVPDSWTLFGDSAVTKRGAQARVTASNGGIQQTINCVALRGLDVCLTVVQNIEADSDFYAGMLRFSCDGGATVGDGRWSSVPYQTWGKLRPFMHLFHVPVTASNLTIAIVAGATGTGATVLDRAVLVLGTDPKDVVTGMEVI